MDDTRKRRAEPKVRSIGRQKQRDATQQSVTESHHAARLSAGEVTRPLTTKEHALRETIRRRFHAGAGTDCVAILDRLRFNCEADPTPAFRRLRGFRPGRSFFPHANRQSFQPYGHVMWFESTASKMKLYVESSPTNGYVATASVTFIADDQTGLLPEEVVPVLGAIRKPQLSMVELAIDFTPLTGVNRRFVRRHGVFGKLHRDLDTNNPIGDWWGARRGAKRVKSYFKDEVGGHRVESVMRSRFLKHYQIEGINDFPRFVDLLPLRHVWLARLDEEKLIERLRGNRFSARRTIGILRKVRGRERDLGAVLDYLKQEVGLKNTRRLLSELRQNRLIVEALQRWGEKWRAARP